jgi:CDP-L-myo-inositol myo-inositolphosphotransferase
MVAGMSHLARMLIAAERDGARAATVMLAPSPALQKQVAEELDRAGCALTISWQALATADDGDDRAGLGDPRALRDQVLRATAKSTDGLVSRHLNRPISRWITARVLTAFPDARPSQLTVVTALFAVAMFAALILGGPFGPALGGLLYQAASIIDGVDGEIARATYRSSRTGGAMDTAVDMATNVLFALGLTINLTRREGPIYAYVGGAAVALLLFGMAVMALLVKATRSEPSFDLLKEVFRRRFPSGWKAGPVDAVRIVTSRDFFALVAAILAVIGLAWTIPWLMLTAVAFWLFIIAWGALLIFGPRRLGVRDDGLGAIAASRQPAE